MSFARGIGGRLSGRRMIQGLAAGFSGNFASLFSGVLQSVQTDLGLTYGGTPLANAGNTSTAVLTLTGALATVPVPIWAKATNTLAIGAGAQFNIYYDGTGAAAAMVGVTPAAGVGVALTGAGTGLTMTWAAGSSVTNDGWKATSSALADQSAGAVPYSQASAAQQPIVTTGLNGFPGLLFDGVNDCFTSSLNLPTPGTMPTGVLMVMRQPTFITASGIILDGPTAGGGNQLYFNTPAGGVTLQSNNTASITVAHVFNTWSRCRLDYSNSAPDVFRVGASQSVGNAGNAVPQAGRNIGAFSTGSFPSNTELLQLIYLNHVPTAGELAAFDAAVTLKYGATVQL